MRRATEADAERIAEMSQRFVAETRYKSFLDIKPEKVAASVSFLLSNPDAVIFISGNGKATGMIAMMAYDHPFSGERTAFEVVWWVDPEARGDGIRLLRAAEGWAREKGIGKMQMVSPSERVSALYERLGYRWVESSFQRSL